MYISGLFAAEKCARLNFSKLCGCWPCPPWREQNANDVIDSSDLLCVAYIRMYMPWQWKSLNQSTSLALGSVRRPESNRIGSKKNRNTEHLTLPMGNVLGASDRDVFPWAPSPPIVPALVVYFCNFVHGIGGSCCCYYYNYRELRLPFYVYSFAASARLSATSH